MNSKLYNIIGQLNRELTHVRDSFGRQDIIGQLNRKLTNIIEFFFLHK